MKEQQIEAIIFDCDGIFVDSEFLHYQSWQKSMQHFGGDLSHDEYFAYVGNSIDINGRLFAEKIGCNNAHGIIEKKKEYYKIMQKKGVPPITPTVEFFKKLAKQKEQLGVKLAVASAAAKEEMMENLTQLSIVDSFDAIVSGLDDLNEYNDPEGVNKPKPYIYMHTLSLLKCSPASSVVIEDSLSGIRSANGAGCISVAVPNQYTSRQDLSEADFILQSFSEIKPEDFIEKMKKKFGTKE